MEENRMYQYIGETWSTILLGMKMQDAGKTIATSRGSRNISSDFSVKKIFLQSQQYEIGS
jgi:hypothetical protein